MDTNTSRNSSSSSLDSENLAGSPAPNPIILGSPTASVNPGAGDEALIHTNAPQTQDISSVPAGSPAPIQAPSSSGAISTSGVSSTPGSTSVIGSLPDQTATSSGSGPFLVNITKNVEDKNLTINVDQADGLGTTTHIMTLIMPQPDVTVYGQGPSVSINNSGTGTATLVETPGVAHPAPVSASAPSPAGEGRVVGYASTTDELQDSNRLLNALHRDRRPTPADTRHADNGEFVAFQRTFTEDPGYHVDQNIMSLVGSQMTGEPSAEDITLLIDTNARQNSISVVPGLTEYVVGNVRTPLVNAFRSIQELRRPTLAGGGTPTYPSLSPETGFFGYNVSLSSLASALPSNPLWGMAEFRIFQLSVLEFSMDFSSLRYLGYGIRPGNVGRMFAHLLYEILQDPNNPLLTVAQYFENLPMDAHPHAFYVMNTIAMDLLPAFSALEGGTQLWMTTAGGATFTLFAMLRAFFMVRNRLQMFNEFVANNSILRGFRELRGRAQSIFDRQVREIRSRIVMPVIDASHRPLAHRSFREIGNSIRNAILSRFTLTNVLMGALTVVVGAGITRFVQHPQEGFDFLSRVFTFITGSPSGFNNVVGWVRTLPSPSSGGSPTVVIQIADAVSQSSLSLLDVLSRNFNSFVDLIPRDASPPTTLQLIEHVRAIPDLLQNIDFVGEDGTRARMFFADLWVIIKHAAELHRQSR